MNLTVECSLSKRSLFSSGYQELTFVLSDARTNSMNKWKKKNEGYKFVTALLEKDNHKSILPFVFPQKQYNFYFRSTAHADNAASTLTREKKYIQDLFLLF